MDKERTGEGSTKGFPEMGVFFYQLDGPYHY